MEKQNQPRRLMSLDALRGFDMLFIMGGAAFFIALGNLFPIPFFQFCADQMYHVGWNGLKHHDTIFPLFLFIAGISFPFSLEKQRLSGKSNQAIINKVIRRGIKLVILGFIYNGLLNWDFETMRYCSVLGRIGLAWMFAALLFMCTTTRGRIWITAAILVGYWLLIGFIPAPDAPAGTGVYEMEGSLVGYIDRLFMPGRLHLKVHDPEGLLSTVPAIATALLGMLTGEIIKKEDYSDKRRMLIMFVTGVFLLVVGLLWSLVFPINKNLWTSSFVCVVGAYSIWIFLLFYFIIDVLELRRWTLFFTVIGMNSITIYLAQAFVRFSFTSEKIFGGTIGLLPETAQPFGSAIAYILVCWFFLYFLFKKKVFLKV